MTIDVPPVVEIEDVASVPHQGASGWRGDRVGGVIVEERGRVATEMKP